MTPGGPAADPAGVVLLEEGSALDLVCRGLSQDEILTATGEDVGYHASGVRSQLRGVDRWAYKVEHVRVRVARSVIDGALEQYAASEAVGAGASVTALLAALGLRNPNLVKLKRLFPALVDTGDPAFAGLVEQFREADVTRRKTSMAAGMVTKYGTDNAFKLDSFQEAAAQTREKRYGARYTLASGSSLAEAARETFADRMAHEEGFAEDVGSRKWATRRAGFRFRDAQGQPVELPPRLGPEPAPDFVTPRRQFTEAEREQMVARHRQTSQERYGVSHPSKRPEHSEALRQFHATLPPEWYGRIAEGHMRNHGQFYAQTPEGRERASERMRDPQVQARIREAKKERGAFVTSHAERRLHEMLLAEFGEKDVRTQHHDPRYPYACDFYIPSRDLFVELNGFWMHGGRWYDQTENLDQIRFLGAGGRSEIYSVADKTWRERDVAKRAAARKSGLNYVVLWDGSTKLADSLLWAAMGFPDGQDWDHEHSWLDSEGSPEPWMWSSGDLELLWEQNPMVSSWGKLRTRVFAELLLIGQGPPELVAPERVVLLAEQLVAREGIKPVASGDLVCVADWGVGYRCYSCETCVMNDDPAQADFAEDIYTG